MASDIAQRTIKEAEYIVESQSTVRAAAEYFGVSKSTLHTDLTKRLPALDFDLFQKTRKLMSHNFAVRHLRGGEATRKKYL